MLLKKNALREPLPERYFELFIIIIVVQTAYFELCKPTYYLNQLKILRQPDNLLF